MAEKKEKQYVSDNARLMAEWDWEQNSALGLYPDKLTFGSTKRVWWKCEKGHTWFVSPNSRRSTGCPTCSMERHTSFPEQAVFFYIQKFWSAESRYKSDGKELDVFVPELNIGIEYDGEFYHRSDKAMLREKAKDEYFATRHIKVIRIKELSHQGYYKEGFTYYYYPDSAYKNLEPVIDHLLVELGVSSAPIDVDIERDRAVIIEQYLHKEKENSVAIARPDIALEWDYELNKGLRPDQVNIYSRLKVYWLCNKGHSWSAAVYSRTAGNGCPHCSGKILTIGQNDLESQNPTLCREWDYEKNSDLLPNQITVNNGKKVWWKCSVCDCSWQASVAHRNSGRGCPVCSQKASTRKINDTKIRTTGSLQSMFPNIANEWNFDKNVGMTPDDFTPRSGRKVWWKCSVCNNEWEAFISNRAKGSGCPECAKRERTKSTTNSRIQEVGSLADRFPTITLEWNYARNADLTPSTITPGSSRKVWWKCADCGYEWEAFVYNRTKKGQGCPKCYRKKRFPNK